MISTSRVAITLWSGILGREDVARKPYHFDLSLGGVIPMDINLHDCELRSISFAFPDASIVFADLAADRYIYLDITNCGKIIFDSDHVQNVIDKMVSFSSYEEFCEDNPYNSDFFFEYARNSFDSIQINKDIGSSFKIVCISALTGGDVFIVCENLNVTFGN